MASKKRPAAAAATDDASASASDALKPMERKKQRKALDKKSRQPDPETLILKTLTPLPPPSSSSAAPSLHVNLFRSLSSPDPTLRESAAKSLASELRDVQLAFEQRGADPSTVMLEAEKDDGLENCAPSLRYAIRRLIRGVSSSRECARQGFALALTAVAAVVPAIRVSSVMKLIVELLEVSASMKGQDARDCLLGRLFAYAALARSGKVIAGNDTYELQDFVATIVSLADKKRYLREPIVSIILDIAEKLPLEALSSQVLKAPGINKWFEKAVSNGDPDVLFLALKLQERVSVESGVFGKLLPHPFNSDNFFRRGHLLTLAPCFKESTFCTPRVHSLWPFIVNILVRDMPSQDEDATTRSASSKKQKRSRKNSSFEEITKNIRSFCEVVIEESLLQSSHDRKHLAFNVVLLILPYLSTSCIPIALSNKLVNCLVDILSTEGSWLYNAAQHFLSELVKWSLDDDDRLVGVIIALQKHSNGRFDHLTKTQTVRGLVVKFKTEHGCMLFVHELMSLFVDEGIISDEPSDQSETTEENSEMGPMENKELTESEDSDFLKNWIIDTMPRILKTVKPESDADSRTYSETKFRLQKEIMKFLAVQGLFSASLGTEVTSFELQEKFTWPKTASSSSLRRMCIEQLQSLLEDAQKAEGLPTISNGPEVKDLGSYFMSFLNTLSQIPSVSLYRTLNTEDETAFKKLQKVESKLFCQQTKLEKKALAGKSNKQGVNFEEEIEYTFLLNQEGNLVPGKEANRLHAMRYLLIQLLLQVMLHQNLFSEAATELVICSKKAFPSTFTSESSEEEDEVDDNNNPSLMDVLVEALLSLLPHSSSALRFAVEQVFRFFCDYITDHGLLEMLRLVKKDLKPARYQVAGSDDDSDDDDLLEIEEEDETEEAEYEDVSEGIDGSGATEGEVAQNSPVESEGLDGEESDQEGSDKDEDPSGSADSDSGMDDDAMFRVDPQLVQLFNDRKVSSGHDSPNSQLIPFKLRVLALLEMYLQRNPGNSQVLTTIYPHLAKAFVKYNLTVGSQAAATQNVHKKMKGIQQLAERISGILHKKILKAKDYPKGDDIQLSNIVPLLEKSLNAASCSRHKAVSSLSQASTFWILKIIHARNFSKSDLADIGEIFQATVSNYFNNKKSRLKVGFVKEVIHRYPWLGLQLFSFLLEKCVNAESEFRQLEAIDVVGCIMKTWTATNKGDHASGETTKLLKKHIPSLCELFHKHLSKLPAKQSRRAQVRQFCKQALQVILTLNLKKTFLKSLKPDALTVCESQLGTAFNPFKPHTV